MQLEGTVALVTGGAKRVGRAIALELAAGGCDVAIHYHTSREEAEQLASEIADLERSASGLCRRAVTVHADLSHPARCAGVVEETVSRLGRLDILVNNAAIFPGRGSDSVDEFDSDLWERIHRINVLAPMALSRSAKAHLESRGGGHIINLCDAASDRPWPDHLGYGTSKAALAALTKGLARAMAPGIRVNGVAPGIAAFPEDYDEATRRRLTDAVPLEREGSPKDVAKAVRFLVEQGDYITGEIVVVDGGRSLR